MGGSPADILYSSNQVKKNNSIKHTTSRLILDLENTFEVLCHIGQIYKLFKYGIPNEMPK